MNKPSMQKAIGNTGNIESLEFVGGRVEPPFLFRYRSESCNIRIDLYTKEIVAKSRIDY